MAVAEKVTVELELKDQAYNAKLKSSEREFQRSMDATKKAAAQAERDIERTMGSVPDSLRQKYRELGTDIGRSFSDASGVARIAFAAIVGYSLNAARKAEDINDAFKFTFNAIGADAEKAAERIATSFGRTTVSVKANLNNAYQILTGVGLSAERSFNAAQVIAERSIDLASQKGISDARAYQAIISGLTGETEPLKGLGVVLNEAAVKAELLRLGFKGNAEAATDAQKTAARLNLILAKTATAQGDVARTADSANNKMKVAQTEFENAATALGEELLPALVQVFGAATEVLKAFNALPGGVQVAGLAFLGLIAAGGPIAGLLANLNRVRILALETAAALGAIGGAKGAAGRGAAAGGAAGLLARVAPVAAVGAGLITGLGSFNKGPDQMTISELESEIRNRRTSGVGSKQYTDSLQRELDLKRRIATTQASMLAFVNGPSTAPVDTSVVGGFGLGDLANGRASGGGSGGTGGGSSAASEAAQKLDRLRADLARIQESQLTDAERAAKELAETIATINAAVEGNIITPEIGAALNRGASTQDIIAPDPIELEPLGNEAMEIGQSIRDGFLADQAAFQEKGAAAGQAFTDILLSGNVWEALGYKFADAAANNLQTLLSQVFTAVFANQGQGASILNSIGTVLGFGGGRANGGPVRAGWSYDVGENGREKFVAPSNGYILPNMNTVAQRASSITRVEVRQTFDLMGVTGDAAIYSNVSQMIKQGQAETLAIANRAAPGAQRQRALLKD